MKIKIRIVGNVVAAILLLIITLPLYLSFLLHIPFIQNLVVKQLSSYSTNYLGSQVSIERVNIGLFYRAYIDGFYVEDPTENDTLLYVKKLSVKLNTLRFSEGLNFDYAKIDGGNFYLNSDSTGLTLNIKQITDKLKSKNPKSNKKEFKLNINDIEIQNFNFEYRKTGAPPKEYGINYQDMRFNNIKIEAHDFNLITDSINMTVDSLKFSEKSGFEVKNISADNLKLCSSEIRADQGNIEFENSNVALAHYAMYYKEWNMANYIDSVVMDVKINKGHIDFRDIAKFTPKEQVWKTALDFKGEALGTVSNMNAKLTDISTYSTSLKEVTGTIKGLPNIEKTNFEINIKGLNSSINDFSKISYDFIGKNISFLNKLSNLTSIKFDGGFKGELNKFKSKGDITTNFGYLKFNLSNTPAKKGIQLKGDVSTKNFDIGRMLKIKNMGRITLAGDMDALAGGDTLIVDTKANIKSLDYNSYNYTDINIDGKIINKTFYGYVGCDDSNINFNFNGDLNIEDEIPLYDFNLEIKRADLVALNFNKKDSVSIFKGALTAEGSGIKLDNMNGNIMIDSLTYINSIDTVIVDRITFETRNSENSKLMKLKSQFVDIELQGKQSYSNIFKYLIRTVKKYLPSIQEGAENYTEFKKGKKTIIPSIEKELSDTTNLQAAQDGYYIATVNVKKANNVASIFLPGLKVSEGTNLSFVFNPGVNEFSFNFNADSISIKNTYITGINIDSRAMKDSISIYARSKEMMFNNIYIPNFLLLGGIKNNSVNLDSRFFNSEDNSEALISTRSIFDRDPSTGTLRLKMTMLPSRFSLGSDKWSSSTGVITLDTSKINISKISIFAKDKSFTVSGDISNKLSDTLNIVVRNLDLSPLTMLTDAMGYKIAGEVDGTINIASVISYPHLNTDLTFENMAINDRQFEDLTFTSRWSKKHEATLFSLTQNGVPPLINGAIKMADKLINTDINVTDVDLSLISPFTRGMFSNIDGTADINVKLTNPNKKLRFDGDVKINKFSTTIDFTKVRYTASGHVKIENNHFKLYDGQLKDELGSSCDLNAEVLGKNFKNVDYTISANPYKMLCMNTTLADNETFYGHIFGTGNLTVIGYGTNVVMNVAAKSEPNSTFFMPLSSKSSMTQANFIEFLKPDTISEDKKKILINRQNTKVVTKKQSSFAINLNLDVQPNIEAQIVIDPTVGNIIKGRGTGDLAIHVNPSENILTINGGIEIVEGSYLFTLNNFINKYFKIQPGSTLNWTGNPLDANLNITATYLVKTSLAPLMGNDPQYSKRVEVDCDLTLSGQLLKPNINLGISLPNSEPEVQSFMNSVLNTEEAISTQIFWLLFANTFYADSNNATFSSSGLTTGAAVTGLEFLSNQISNWVSSDKFNLGFSYRPKGDMTSDELELRIFAPILKDKLTLDAEGNLNFKNNQAYVTENVKMLTGDLALTWIIDPVANLSAKLFTHPIDTFDENQGLQETGVGVYYKDDFNKFSDLVQKYRANKKERQKTREVKRETIDSIGRKLYRIHQKRKN